MWTSGVDFPASLIRAAREIRELQTHVIEREVAAVAIWLPGGLSETSQPACTAGTAPISYYSEECLSSSEKKTLLLPAAFSIISAFGECGSQEDVGIIKL